MRRRDESQRVRRSVCGQNQMYPALKGVFKLPIWSGTVVGSIPQHPPPTPRPTTPAGSTSSCSTQARLHTHTQRNTTQASTAWEIEEHRPQFKHPAAATKTHLPTNGLCRVYSKSTCLITSPENICFNLKAQASCNTLHPLSLPRYTHQSS